MFLIFGSKYNCDNCLLNFYYSVEVQQKVINQCTLAYKVTMQHWCIFNKIDKRHNDQLRFIASCYGFQLLHDTGPTHQRGGTIDAVMTLSWNDRPNERLCDVTPHDVGLSDHRLLCWSADAARPSPAKSTVTSRPWRSLDIEQFRAAIAGSLLCQPDIWPADSVDRMCRLYHDVLLDLLDRFIPVRQTVRRPRPSDVWFDAECRAAKRLTRRLERAFIAADRRASAGRVPDRAAQWLPLRLLRRPGISNAVITVAFETRSVVNSGFISSMTIGLIRNDSGKLSTNCWVADISQLPQPSRPRSFAGSSTRRSVVSES
jgi:hypothetical protein